MQRTFGAEVVFMLSTRVLVVAGAAAAAASAVATRRYLHHARTWGATPEEAEDLLPGDGLCPEPELVVTRAITIDAPPDHVWPWITQIGQDRGGFYSYTWLENLFGARMPEVHRLRAEWSTREVGDRIWMASPDRTGREVCNVVAEVIPGRALVMVAPDDPARLAGGGHATWVWQFCVLPGPLLGTTRLIVRSRYGMRMPGLEPVHFVMERRMLRTIAKLAERHWEELRSDPFPRAAPEADLTPVREGDRAAAHR